ncbi:DUF6461 domain-containing protein [Streptomyces sp. NPDC002812]|uniref:DUF6461 domain-containing protein n=1 Tax=unclassified Streptomyces TaxID=2593676 RepID=UPI00202EFA06|nr:MULTISPECIES: DUF6461 domain-containing protein [unclassified Streptomyces]MCM1965947.1 DUF6461 domain-containing protein [Streptomyces sp. G1]MCX5126606.1 DUF6461 domain-containing protein [Streptomyces sp. NBC_00347]MCX5300240.1 DUF6461 domain-containing protein [Streptomyces sp. NBC_00193]
MADITRQGAGDGARGCDGGIQWLADWSAWYVSLTFARGIGPEELAARLGALPDLRPGPLGAIDAWSMVTETVDGDGVARVGSWGGWSFAVEHGVPAGAQRLAEVSRSGAEAVYLDPQPDHPPKQFAYARDGELVCCFGIGEEHWRGGHRPDFLLPELVEAKILTPDGCYARPEDEPSGERDRLTLAVLEHRFALSLPRRLVEETPLPAFVTCTH